MRVLHFIKVSFLLNGVLGATIKTPDSGENTDVNSIMVHARLCSLAENVWLTRAVNLGI